MLVGIDFGATTIKGGVVTQEGQLIKKSRLKTLSQKGPDGLMDDIAALIGELTLGKEIEGIGVGLCGMVDTVTQTVLYTTDTLPGWTDVPLSNEIEKRTGVPCVCDNDSNVAALGEYLVGAGKGTKSMVLFTLGTGVGGGVVLDGRVLQGASFTAGHLGHIKVRAGGRKCPCGAKGCIEAYASAWAMKRAMRKDPPEIFRLAKAGDKRAMAIVEEAAWALGRGFSDLACTINPEMIVVGGGMAKGWPQLKKRALGTFAEYALKGSTAATKIRQAKLGNDAGIIGAALNAVRKTSSKGRLSNR